MSVQNRLRYLFCIFITLPLLGCGPRSVNYVGYRMPDHIDVKDKNECSRAAGNNADTLVKNKSTATTENLEIPVNIGSTTVYVPIETNQSNSRTLSDIKNSDLAVKKYLQACLRKKGYKLDD